MGTCLHLHPSGPRRFPPPRGMQDPVMRHNNNVSMTTHNTCMHEGATWRPSFLGRHGAKPRSKHDGSEYMPVLTHLPSPSCSDANSTIVLRSCIGISRVALSMTFGAALLAPAWVPSSSAQMSSPS